MRTEFTFRGYLKNEEGLTACLETTGDMAIPVNIFIDNSDEVEICENERCFVEVGGVGGDYEVYESEEAYERAQTEPTHMAAVSMIPIGTFPADNDYEHFQWSSHILFCGKVLHSEYREAAPDRPNYCLTVETLGLTFELMTHYDGRIAEGYVVKGVAWLFGNMYKEG